MNNIIGIDLGTTHCKLVIVSPEGKVVFSAKKNCQSFTGDDGRHEQDAEDICQMVLDLLAQAFKYMPENAISAVSFSAAMHSLLAVDEGGKPLMKAVTWADTRAAQYAQQIKTYDAAADIYAQTGTPIHAMSPLCKIVWLRHERPEIFNLAAKFISIKEYIFHALFGRYVVDHSIASATGLFNIHTRQWHKPALQVAGITEDKLSQPLEVLHAETSLLPLIKQEIGITVDLPFILGCSDGAAAQLGSGTLLANEACVTIGTSGAVRRFIKQAITHPQQKTFTYAFLPGWYLTGGATNNGGNVLQWFPSIFKVNDDGGDKLAAIAKMAEESEAGARGLLFTPYLNGERSPVWDAGATAQLTGLRNTHTVSDIARAVTEGILLNIWEIYQTLPGTEDVDTIYANGGFFGNAFLAQLLADISGKKIMLQEDADSSAMGAVYLAWLYGGKLKTIEDVKLYTIADITYIKRDDEYMAYKKVVKNYLSHH